MVLSGAALEPAQAQAGSSLSIFNASVTEGDSGTTTMTFFVSLSPCSNDPVTVNFATSDGTATAGSDYVATSGTLTFAAADTSETISVTVNGDLLDEGASENFTITLSGANGATIGTATATGTIVDEDPVRVTNFFGTSEFEGDLGTTPLDFWVYLNKPVPTGETFSVDYTTGGMSDTAIGDNVDYIDAIGTLSFSAGEQFKFFSILIDGDTSDESNEFFTVTLSNPLINGVAAPDALTGIGPSTGTIIDDDPLTVSVFNDSTDEGDPGDTNQLFFDVELNKDPGATVSVAYTTTTGSAGSGSDFTAASGTLTWNAGDPLTQTVVVDVIEDTSDEGTESFTLDLSSPSGLTIADASGSGTIFDDDPLAVDEFYTFDADESDGTMTFYVDLNKPAPGPVSVDFSTADGSAIAGSDYSAVTSGTVNFATNDQFESFAITLLDDSTVEPDEDFTVTLSNPVGVAFATATTVTGTIYDDDAVPPPPPPGCAPASPPPPPPPGPTDPPSPTPEPTSSPSPTPDPEPTPCEGDPQNLCATPDADDLVVEESGVTLDSGGGDDSITVEGDNVTVNTGTGSDFIEVIGDNVTVNGGGGNDEIVLNGRNGEANGGGGQDDIQGGSFADDISGGDGADITDGGGGDDDVGGGSGPDQVGGGGGDDDMSGGPGADEMFGDANQSAAAAAVRARARGAALTAEQSTAVAQAEAAQAGGNDLINSGDGWDVVFGGGGNDDVFASFGNDNVAGGGGNDLIRGWDGDDEITGGDGDDEIRSGAGRNNVTAGGGTDICLLNLNDTARGCEVEKRSHKKTHKKTHAIGFGGDGAAAAVVPRRRVTGSG